MATATFWSRQFITKQNLNWCPTNLKILIRLSTWAFSKNFHNPTLLEINSLGFLHDEKALIRSDILHHHLIQWLLKRWNTKLYHFPKCTVAIYRSITLNHTSTAVCGRPRKLTLRDKRVLTHLMTCSGTKMAVDGTRTINLKREDQ